MTVDPTTGVGPAAEEPTSIDEDLLTRLSGPIFRDALEGMIVMSYDDGIYLEANDTICRMIGRERDDIVGRTSKQLQFWADPDQRAELRERLEANAGFVHTQVTIAHADGHTIVAEGNARLMNVDGRRLLFGTVVDVGEREQATASLREAERRFRTLVEAIPAVVYLDLLDEDSTNVYTSPQAEETFGYPMSEWEADPKKWISLLHPDDRDRVLAEQAAHVPEPSHFMSEYRMIAKDGREVWVHDEAVPLAGQDGRPAYWQGMWFDVTSRKQAEAAFRESEQRYRMVVESATDLIALVDPDATIVYASPSHATVLGYAPEEIVGRSVFAFDHPDSDRASRDSFARARGGVRQPPMRFRLVHRDGHALDLEGVGWQPLFDEAGQIRYFLAISRDITDRLRAEEERRRLLARVVEAQEEERHRIAVDVHDDPLQAVTALGLRLQLLRSHVDAEGAELLAKLGSTVERAQTSLRTLLFELRPPSLDREGLAAAIREELRVTGEGRLESEVVDDMAGGDPSPQHRIVLYRIAREALVNVGKHANAAHVWVHLRDVEGGPLLRIEDDGSGLSDDDGSGLHFGVSTMRERAELEGGWLRLSPRPEGGTMVECWLPS